jgi:succinate dehydrogenase flavin-adding protein (antitoxin of CptAB toxin-antitoxin module)
MAALSRKELSYNNIYINNKARIHWASRRDMRDLEISIMPFFEYKYDQLNDTGKALFARLLECDDSICLTGL